MNCLHFEDTRGTIYILSLIMKISNLSLKMSLLFLKVFSFMIYRLLYAFEHFWSICLHQSTLASFWAFVKLCGIQREQIFFIAKCSCNILYMLVELMPEVSSISQYVIWQSCIISFGTALMFSGPITDFGRPLRNSSVSEWRPRLNSLCQRSTVAKDRASSTKMEISWSMHSCLDNPRQKS